ncbi:MAG: DNA repair protein RecO [Patescibacteria group bacterium]
MGVFMTEGIVLKHSPWREADRIIVLFSRDYGKMSVVARSARKISSKLAGSIEPVTLLLVSVVRGKRYDTLAGAEEIYTYPLLRRSLPATAMAMLIGEVIDRSMFPSQNDRQIFVLLDQSLRDLEQASKRSRSDVILVAWRFVWQFLDVVGYRPELHQCVECHERVKQEKNWFDYKKGGLICPRCGRSAPDRVAVAPEMIKIIRWLVSTPPSHVRLKVPISLILSVGRLTNAYLNFTHEHGMDFRPFLKLA